MLAAVGCKATPDMMYFNPTRNQLDRESVLARCVDDDGYVSVIKVNKLHTTIDGVDLVADDSALEGASFRSKGSLFVNTTPLGGTFVLVTSEQAA